MFRKLVVVVAAIATAASSIFSSNSSVVLLDADSFEKQVIQSKEHWIIEFFAPWCGHCKSFASEYEKAAYALEGTIKFGAIEDQSVMQKYGVKGFPTVRFFFSSQKTKTVDFTDNRTSDKVVEWALENVRNFASVRLGKPLNSGNDSSSNNNNNNTNNNTNKNNNNASGSNSGSGPDVVVVTEANFNSLVLNDTENSWFIKFYAPWCGHCKSLEPVWNQLGAQLKGKVKIAKIDATVEQKLASQFNIRGYPTLKMLPAGKKTVSGAIDYQQARTLDALRSFSLKYASVVKAQQLLNNNKFKSSCESTVCIIAFLPNLHETTAAQRNAYLNNYNNAIKKMSGIPANFFWLQGGDNFQLEEQLSLQFGYPALIGVTLNKGYAVHRGHFTEESISLFLTEVASGRIAVTKMPPKLAALKDSKPWDGKDIPKEMKDEL